MSTPPVDNPFAPPASDDDAPPAPLPTPAWRDGRFLVTPPRPTGDGRCVRCGAPGTRDAFGVSHEVGERTVPVGLAGMVRNAASGRQHVFAVRLCDRHARSRRGMQVAWAFVAVAGLTAAVATFLLERGALLCVGLPALILGGVMLVRGSPSLVQYARDGGLIWWRGAAAATSGSFRSSPTDRQCTGELQSVQ